MLEGVAHRVGDVSETMAEELGHPIPYLRVDGWHDPQRIPDTVPGGRAGGSGTRLFLPGHDRPGVGLMAGRALGWWRDRDDLEAAHPPTRTYEPSMSGDRRGELRNRWKKAVEAVHVFK